MAQTRRDLVVILVQYDQDVDDDQILAIHEATQLGYEGVVDVRATFGIEDHAGLQPLPVGTPLGIAPARYSVPEPAQTD